MKKHLLILALMLQPPIMVLVFLLSTVSGFATNTYSSPTVILDLDHHPDIDYYSNLLVSKGYQLEKEHSTAECLYPNKIFRLSLPEASFLRVDLKYTPKTRLVSEAAISAHLRYETYKKELRLLYDYLLHNFGQPDSVAYHDDFSGASKDRLSFSMISRSDEDTFSVNTILGNQNAVTVLWSKPHYHVTLTKLKPDAIVSAGNFWCFITQKDADLLLKKELESLKDKKKIRTNIILLITGLCILALFFIIFRLKRKMQERISLNKRTTINQGKGRW